MAASLACEAGEILFLDDQPLNVDAARAAGLHAARVSGVQEAEAALIEAGALS